MEEAIEISLKEYRKLVQDSKNMDYFMKQGFENLDHTFHRYFHHLPSLEDGQTPSEWLEIVEPFFEDDDDENFWDDSGW